MKANQIVKRHAIYNGVFSSSISWSILQLLSNLSLPPATSHLFQAKYVGFLLVFFAWQDFQITILVALLGIESPFFMFPLKHGP